MRNLANFTASVMLALVVLPSAASADGFKLESADIPTAGKIGQKFVFNAFGCTGENVSPSLSWSGAPEGTKSFALMVHDPDAKTGGAGFWHWIVTDIPGAVSSINAGAGTADGTKLPTGAHQAPTDFGAPGWGGPCPPEKDGAHTYNFTLYALPVDKLDLPTGATASLTGFVVNSMAVGSATLSATYDR